MQREIKFRGKKISDGQWIIGDHYYVDGKPFINNQDCWNSQDDYEVHPETVGQYTDFLDKELKEIYEGMKAVDDYGATCFIAMVDGCFSIVEDLEKKSYPMPLKDYFRQITVEV